MSEVKGQGRSEAKCNLSIDGSPSKTCHLVQVNGNGIPWLRSAWTYEQVRNINIRHLALFVNEVLAILLDHNHSLLCTFEFYTVHYSVTAAHKWLDPVLAI